ncbi:MAG: portal protein [Emcibacter sp.]|nr:portal protein [Emcibacter sp.]
MAAPTAKDAQARCKAAFGDKAKYESETEDIYTYAMPNRNQYKSGSNKMDRVFDSTAIDSTQSFANRLQADLTPPFQRWSELKPGPAISDEDREALDPILEGISAVVHGTLQSGGFMTAGHEVYQDLAAGEGSMLILPGDTNSPVRYVAQPQREVAIEEGAWGQTIGWYRKHKINAKDIKSWWPEAKIGAEIKKKVDSDHKSMIEVAQAYIQDSDPTSDKWHYIVLFKGQEAAAVEQEFNYQPFAAPRWSRIAGEQRGRGPLHLALPDIKTINKVKEFLLMNAAIAVVGAYTVVDDGVVNVNNVQIVPGALISVASNGTGFTGPSIKPLETARTFDISQFIIEDLRASIKRMMLDDNLPPELGAVRSPTEIVARAKKLSQDSGAAFGRLYDEWIVPIWRATVAILQQKKIIAEAAKIPIDNLNFKIQVTSPLARIQDIQDLEGIIQYFEIAGSVVGQEGMLMSTKLEDLIPWLADRLGVPARFIRNEDERKVLQALIAKIVAAQSEQPQQGEQAA